MSDSPEVTNASYARWLQAQRPPFDWFMSLPVLVQETLAEQGSIHRIEAAIDLGKAIRNPDLFEAQCYAADDPDAEAVLVQHLAAQTVAQLVGDDTGPVSPPKRSAPDRRTSFVGALQERDEAEEAARVASAGQRPFMGVMPDAAREDTG